MCSFPRVLSALLAYKLHVQRNSRMGAQEIQATCSALCIAFSTPGVGITIAKYWTYEGFGCLSPR
jgi:hypothetical protein